MKMMKFLRLLPPLEHCILCRCPMISLVFDSNSLMFPTCFVLLCSIDVLSSLLLRTTSLLLTEPHHFKKKHWFLYVFRASESMGNYDNI